jgi:response regulator RpfG family c-di-GMP phosphodiesterase
LNKLKRVGVRLKVILVLIPLLAGSFAVAGYVAVGVSRSQLIAASGDLLRYKMEQLQKYSSNQWTSLAESDFADDPVYTEVVRRSIERYANDMISRESEVIFSVSQDGVLEFSTRDIGYSGDVWPSIEDKAPGMVTGLAQYRIDGVLYYGLSASTRCSECRIFVMETASSFTRNIRSMTLLQSITFAVSLLVIVVAIIVSLNMVVGPIRHISQSAREIASDKDLTRHIEVEYPDEIGQLAYEFNNMTTSLDLAIRKLKRKALDEAVAKKTVLLREIEALEVIGKASNFKDSETGSHIVRVSNYSVLLSRLIGHSEELQNLILLASPLHDIGKLGIPDSILQKPGPLTPEELRIIHTHTNIGYEILRNPTSKYLKAGAVIAISHHEKYDGTGYPYGLEGESIPIFGRIVSIVDVFDAVTSTRPYKAAWEFDKAVEYLESERGKHFDPELIDLFMANIDDVRRIHDEAESIYSSPIS